MQEHSAVPLPPVIQGGMGVAVSSWPLARAVAAAGQLGVVSGTALDAVLARRLQDGDPGGHLRTALAAFPVPEMAEHVLARYFRLGGRGPGEPYAPGDVYPAGFLPLSVGNVREQPLPDIYTGSPLLRDIRAAHFGGRCGRCEYADLCGGSRARAYAASGDPLGEDPACALT